MFHIPEYEFVKIRILLLMSIEYVVSLRFLGKSSFDFGVALERLEQLVQIIVSPSACRGASRFLASQRAATRDRKEMQATAEALVSDDTFRTPIAEDREALSAPVSANAPHPPPRSISTFMFIDEPEAPAVRKTEPAPSSARADVSEPAAGGGTRDPRPASSASSLSPCCVSASIEELEAPATCTAEMEAEPAPAYDAEQAQLEAVEKMRLWHAERNATLPSFRVRLAIVARAVTNHHGGKHDEWAIKDEPGEGLDATIDEKASPLAVAEPAKMADNDNDNDPSSSAQSIDVAPTDGMGWGLQEALGCFMVTCAAGADDAVTSDDAPEDLDCVRPAAGVQPNAAAAVPIEWSLWSPIVGCVACTGACEGDEGMNAYSLVAAPDECGLDAAFGAKGDDRESAPPLPLELSHPALTVG